MPRRNRHAKNSTKFYAPTILKDLKKEYRKQNTKTENMADNEAPKKNRV